MARAATATDSDRLNGSLHDASWNFRTPHAHFARLVCSTNTTLSAKAQGSCKPTKSHLGVLWTAKRYLGKIRKTPGKLRSLLRCLSDNCNNQSKEGQGRVSRFTAILHNILLAQSKQTRTSISHLKDFCTMLPIGIWFEMRFDLD